MPTAKQTFFCTGFFLSSITVLFLGDVTNRLKLSGDFSDPITLTWFTFLCGGYHFGPYGSGRRGKLGEVQNLRKQDCSPAAAG